MSAVVLVEFAATDRFHRRASFPYVHGWLKHLGVAVRWLRFGVGAARRFERGEEGLGLSEAEWGTLAEVLTEVGASHVLFGSRPAESLLARFHAGSLPAPRLGLFESLSGAPRPRGLDVVDEKPAALSAFLGLPSPADDLPLHRVACPDFGFEAANDAARSAPALPFLVLGRECTFSLPFARNPFLSGLDLSGCARRGGCSFCVRPPEEAGPWDLAPDELRAHLAALRATAPPSASRGAVRLLGEPALRHLDAVVGALLAEGFRDVDWLLDARADALVQRADELAAAATRLAGTGNRLHVALIGIESFSAAELERLNKGVDPLTNLAAVATLLELEQRCAGSFAFREHGGLSLILFTPWTRPPDLVANLRLIQLTGLEPLCGKVFTSRLRLVPGLPLTERARVDGLLVEAYDDPLLDTAARNLYDPELPWRFQASALESACRLLLRFPGATPSADPLAAPVQRALDRARRIGLNPIDVAIRIVELATDDEPPQALLARVEGWVVERGGERDATRRGERWADVGSAAGSDTAVSQRLAVFLSERGLKPVSKLEPLSGPRAEALVAGGELPNAVQRKRLTGTADAAVHEVFFGADPERVAAAVNATLRLEQPPSDEAERRAVADAGRLLGYPACCSEAFSAARSSGRWSYVWLHLRRRVEVPGAVPWQFHPWASSLLTPHVPCSLACAESLGLAEATAAALAEVEGPAALAEIEARARNPWLAVLEGQGAAIELVPEGTPGERFRYRAARSTDAASADLALVAGGDELVVEPLRLLVLRRGCLHADLSLRGFVWWFERALQVEAWTRLLAIRERTLLAPGGGGPALDGAAEPDVAKATPRLLKLRSLLLQALPPRGVADLAGFEAASLRVISHGRLRLVLARGAERLALEVEEARADTRCWLRVGPFALTIPGGAEMPAGDALQAVEALVRRLEAVLRAAGARLLKGADR